MATQIPIPLVAAPLQRNRMSRADLEAEISSRQQRFNAAATDIKNTKRDRQNMINSLDQKGIRIASFAQYDDAYLLQLILWWYLLDAEMQRIVSLSRPIFDLKTPQPQPDTVLIKDEDMKGATLMRVLRDGTCANVCRLSTSARFYQLPGTNTPTPTREMIEQHPRLKISEKYDAAVATMYQRFDLASLLDAESPGQGNLYGLQVIAHEFEHAVQSSLEPIYGPLTAMTKARTAFMTEGSDDNLSPIMLIFEGTKEDVKAPPPRITFEDKWRYLLLGDQHRSVVDFELDPQQYPGLDEHLQLCIQAGVVTQHVADQHDVGLLSSFVLPIKFISNMYAEILSVIKDLTDNQSNIGPFTDAPSSAISVAAAQPCFFDKWLGLAKYLSTECNGAIDQSLVPSVVATRDLTVVLPKLPPCTHNPATSLFAAIMSMIDHCPETNISRENAEKLKASIKKIQTAGFEAIRHAIYLHMVETAWATEVCKQTTALFPNLLGRYTYYANKYFNSAIDRTASRLLPVFQSATPEYSILRILPNKVQVAVREILNRHNTLKWQLADVKKNLTTAQIYQLGAPQGIFNAYAREYDSETCAMWWTCPEEFVAMYTRDKAYMKDNGITDDDIMSQVTYAARKGVREFGGIPRYV